MSNDRKAIVQRWFEEVWNKKRAEAIDELLADDGVVHGLGAASLRGSAGFKSFHSAYLGAFPDLVIQLDDVIGEGELVAARWSGTATHEGNGLGIPASGKRIDFDGMTFIRIVDGRVVEAWNNFNQLGMLQQIGVTSLPPAAV